MCHSIHHRNPGGTQQSGQPGPWCFVDIVINQSVEKVIEMCDIPRCSDKMWLFVIAPFISLVLLLMITVSIVCCRKFRKNDSRDGISNIHNVSELSCYQLHSIQIGVGFSCVRVLMNFCFVQQINVTGSGKNIYGNSRLNSPIEMTSLLTVGANQQENGNINVSTNHDSNATITSNQNQQHVASMQNGKPQLSKQQQSYASHRNNSFSLYKCPSQTNGGGSICGSIKSSDTGNDDTTSFCTSTSDGGGGGGSGGVGGGGRSSSRGSALRVRQYMLHHVRFVEELGMFGFPHCCSFCFAFVIRFFLLLILDFKVRALLVKCIKVN